MAKEPAFSLSGLSIWIDGRQFPESNDYWDANWLNLRVQMQAEGATVKCSGAILMTTDFERFRSDLRELHKNLKGYAQLAGHEPELKLILTGEQLGQINVAVEVTPDHLSQFHRFELGLDQSYLPGLLHSLDRILVEFPVLHAEN